MLSRLCSAALVILVFGLAGGCSSARSAGMLSRPDRSDSPAGSGVRFEEIASAAGLAFRWKSVKKAPLNILEISSAGAGFIDFDRDGWLDIALVGPEGCGLFRNQGDGRFSDVTRAVGLDRLSGRWHGLAVADIDNDGWPDMLITGYRKQVLLRNDAGKRFVDASAGSGVASNTWGTSASFFDADRDGWVDLLLGSYVKFGPGSPEFMDRNGVKITLGPDAYEGEKLRYFRNLGGFRFREATREAGFHVTMGRNFGIAAADFDNDGDDDVYVANDEMPGNLFVNDGRGRFVDEGTTSGTALSGTGRRQGGMGAAWGDFNNDLRPDLIVTTFTQEPKSLYRNDGGGFFTECSYETQLTQGILPWVGFGVVFVDVDRDGRQDLAMVNGHVEDLIRRVDPSNDYPQPMKLFLNRGGRFEDASETTGPGFRRSIVGRALAVGDIDNDGDPDLLAADLEGAPVLLRNDSRVRAHWLGLHLIGGDASNRMALGAQVILSTPRGRQWREVRTDGSYLSAHDPRILFGLGEDDRVGEVRIRWPSGRVQTARGLQPDRYYRWREGETPAALP